MVAFGVEMLVIGIESQKIGVAFFNDFHNADYTRHIAVGMIEKNLIAQFHVVPHHVPGLIITYTVPMFGLVGLVVKIVNPEGIGFGFH